MHQAWDLDDFGKDTKMDSSWDAQQSHVWKFIEGRRGELKNQELKVKLLSIFVLEKECPPSV